MTDAEFRAWLARDNEQRCILVELDYIYEALDSPTAPVTGTLYLSDREFFDDVTDNIYVDCVRAAPQYTRALSGEQLGAYISSIGSLELDNADGELDFALSLAIDGGQIRFYYGGQAWPVADFRHIFTATASRASAPAFDRISVVLKDTGLLLDKSIGSLFAVGGTGPNAEKSQMIPFGYIHNQEAFVYDEPTLLYAFSDGGFTTSAEEVRDRGVSVAYTPSVAGAFTLSAAPDGLITCDVLSEPMGAGNTAVSDAFDFFIGQRAGLTALGLYDGAGPTFTVHDADDYLLGVLLSEPRNAIDLLRDICDSGNCSWAIKRTGEFTFLRLRLNDISVFTDGSPPAIEEVSIVEDDIDQGSFKLDHMAPQYYKYQAYMSRNWVKQSDLASSLNADEQAVYRRDGIYLVQPDATGTTYAEAPELYHKTLAISPTVDTLLSEEFSPTDVDSLAQWMTTRRAMFLPWIEVITIVVGIDFYTLELGDPVRLFIAPRMGEDDTGTLFQVIGIVLRLTDAKIELRLARRNVIQPIPESWTRAESAVDDTQQEYILAPLTITQPETGAGAWGPLGPGAGRGGPGGGGGGGGGGGPIGGEEGHPFGNVNKLVIHPDILLWVPFAAGATTDVSSYNRTPTVTNDCATFIAGFMYINVTSSSPTSFTAQITYPIDPLPYGGTQATSIPMTFEGFVKWVASPNNTDPYHIFRYSPHPTVPVDIRRYKGSNNTGKIEYNDSGLGIEAGPTATNVLAPSGTLYHWAWNFPAAGVDGDTNRFYINGVQVLSYVTTRSATIGSGAYWSIGGTVATNSSPNHVEIYLGETRVVARSLYPGGSSFTPPTPGNLSVIS